MISHLIHIGFPNNCVTCSNSLLRNEQHMCSECHFYIPKSDNQLNSNSKTSDLLVSTPILSGASYLLEFDKDGKTQKLLHELKYSSNLKLGSFLGELMAIDFKEQLKDVDFIIPVPLHPKKLYKRGYNQCDVLCEGINKHLTIKVVKSNLIRIKNTETQTKKNKFERIENIKKAFSIKEPNQLKNKTILLVDDVITTGSTLSECLTILSEIEGIKVKVLCLAQATY